jgi:hypothetical protein
VSGSNKELADSIAINIAWQGKNWYLKNPPLIVDWGNLISRIQPFDKIGNSMH